MSSAQLPARFGPRTLISSVNWSAGYVNGQATPCGLPVALVINASGQAALCPVGKRPIGILQNVPNVGQTARYERDGALSYIAGAAITAGQDLTVGANGYLIPAVAGGGVIVGTAFYSAVQGEISVCEFVGFGGTI